MNKQEIEGLKSKVLAKVRADDVNGCWVWVGTTLQSRRKTYDQRCIVPSTRKRLRAPAYPMLKVGGRQVNVRRLVYTLWQVRPLLQGATVRATCGNSLCVNPLHLVRGERRASPGPPRKAAELILG